MTLCIAIFCSVTPNFFFSKDHSGVKEQNSKVDVKSVAGNKFFKTVKTFLKRLLKGRVKIQ